MMRVSTLDVAEERKLFAQWLNANGKTTYIKKLNQEFFETLCREIDLSNAKKISTFYDELYINQPRTGKEYATLAYKEFCLIRRLNPKGFTTSQDSIDSILSLYELLPSIKMVAEVLTEDALDKKCQKSVDKKTLKTKGIVHFSWHRYQAITKWNKTSKRNDIIRTIENKLEIFPLAYKIPVKFSGSHIGQLLNQVQCTALLTQFCEWLPTEKVVEIHRIIAEHLVELYLTVLNWDGTTFIPEKNTPKDFSQVCEKDQSYAELMERISEILRANYGADSSTCNVRQMRNDIFNAANSIRERFSDVAIVRNSGIEQILLQLCSIEVCGGNDWFHGMEVGELVAYIAELLAELFIIILNWDCTSFIPPRIFRSNDVKDWFHILLAIPFTQTLPSTAMMCKLPNHGKDLSMELIKSGVVWVDTRPLVNHPLQKFPIKISFQEKAKNLGIDYTRIWEEGSSDNEFFHNLLDAVVHEQLKIIKNNPKEGSAEVSNLSDEYLDVFLEILKSAEECKTTKKNTVYKLIQVILYFCLEQIEHGTLSLGEKANKIMLDLYSQQRHYVNMAWDKYNNPDEPRAPSLVNPVIRRNDDEIDLTKFSDDLLFKFPNKVLFSVNSSSDQEHDYFVYSKRALHAYFDTSKSWYLEERIAKAVYIFIQTQTANWEERLSESDIDVLLMDYLRPCKNVLEKCKKEICGDDTSKYTCLFKESIAMYDSCLRMAMSSLTAPYTAIFSITGDINVADTDKKTATYSKWAREKLYSKAAICSGKEKCRDNQYFLGDFDSVAMATVYKHKDYEVEVRLMRHLLEGKNIVLTLPMIVDNCLLRNLSSNSGYLRALRSSRIGISPYGNCLNMQNNLCTYAAEQMAKTYKAAQGGDIRYPFKWSSFSDTFNQDDGAREAGAKFLLSKGAPPTDYREDLEKFKESLILLDENIPYESRARFYQRGRPLMLSSDLNAVYSWISNQDQQYSTISDIHKGIEKALKKRDYVRTEYTAIIDFLRGKDSNKYGLTDAQRLSVGEIRDRYIVNKNYMELLDNLELLLNDSYMRTLAAQCHLENVLIPYEPSPLSSQLKLFRKSIGNCNTFEDSTVQSTSERHISWNDLMDYRDEFDSYINSNPECSLEDVVAKMEQTSIVLNTMRIRDEEYLQAVDVHLCTAGSNTDSNCYQLRISPNRGIAHIETRGGK